MAPHNARLRQPRRGASGSLFATRASSRRVDWNQVKQSIRLDEVAIALLGDPPGRRGERDSHLWWNCPFHNDANPSFCIRSGKRRWKCFGCGAEGDVLELVMRIRGIGVGEAMRFLSGDAWGQATSRPNPQTASRREPPRPSGLPLADAEKLVTTSEESLWTHDGSRALDYLRGRGLTDETIRQHRLGWSPGVRIPTRDGDRTYEAQGIVIPWFDRERLNLIKVRQPPGRKPKYAEAFRDRVRLFPSPDVVRVGMPLVVTEGEFDAILLGQELKSWAAVVTLGSASNRPDPLTMNTMLRSPVWLIATDGDEAGDRAGEGWPARSRRVRPPEGFKDWTEAKLAGVDLRGWWASILSGLTPSERPELDPYAIAEREAIQNEASITDDFI